jgi:hypothetical protein
VQLQWQGCDHRNKGAADVMKMCPHNELASAVKRYGSYNEIAAAVMGVCVVMNMRLSK